MSTLSAENAGPPPPGGFEPNWSVAGTDRTVLVPARSRGGVNPRPLVADGTLGAREHARNIFFLLKWVDVSLDRKQFLRPPRYVGSRRRFA